MQKFLEYKEEVDGFQNVEDTVKIIERSAASNIHFLKSRVSVLRDYKENLNLIIGRLSRFYPAEISELFQKRPSGKKFLAVITGNKGIVGSMYHNIVNEAISARYKYDGFYALGERGNEYLEEEGIKAKLLSFGSKEIPASEDLVKISSFFYNQFKDKSVQRIDILYPTYSSLSVQKPALFQLLPFRLEELSGKNFLASEPDGLPIFEPSKKLIFETLLKKYIDIFFTEIIFDAKLSEFSARTIAAENAADETEKLVKKLKLTFLKERRMSVTQRQIESFSAHQTI